MPPRRAAAQPAPGVNPVAQRIFNDLHKGRVTELQVKQLTMTIRSDWTWLLQCAEHRENRSCCVNLQFENGSTKEQVNATHSHVQNFVIKHKDDWWGVVISCNYAQEPPAGDDDGEGTRLQWFSVLKLSPEVAKSRKRKASDKGDATDLGFKMDSKETKIYQEDVVAIRLAKPSEKAQVAKTFFGSGCVGQDMYPETEADAPAYLVKFANEPVENRTQMLAKNWQQFAMATVKGSKKDKQQLEADLKVGAEYVARTTFRLDIGDAAEPPVALNVHLQYDVLHKLNRVGPLELKLPEQEKPSAESSSKQKPKEKTPKKQRDSTGKSVVSASSANKQQNAELQARINKLEKDVKHYKDLHQAEEAARLAIFKEAQGFAKSALNALNTAKRLAGRGGSAIDNPEVPDSFALSLDSPKKAKVKKSRSREPSPARRMPVDP